MKTLLLARAIIQIFLVPIAKGNLLFELVKGISQFARILLTDKNHYNK